MGRALGGLAADDAAFEHLRDVWELTQDPDRTFETKLQLLLSTEADALDLPYGFLTRTDPSADRQVIEAAHGSHELLQPGETAPLSESYCRHTLRTADRTFHVDDARADGWADDPAYERFELGTYVGAPVGFDGERYGTFCFASSAARDQPLSPGEREVVAMLSTWVSNELGVQSTMTALERQTSQVEELAVVVSHDLRSPLNVARGHMELLNETVQESLEQIGAAHQRMGDIIEDMLTLARVDEPVSGPEPVEFRACVEATWELVDTGDATLRTDLGEGTVMGDESRVRRLLENLFRNAVEHGGPAVTVVVGTTDSGFFVADDGPGIPAAEQSAVFETGYSTVEEGTGFGLSIVKQIAEAHGWDVTVTESESGGTRFEFSGVDGSLVESG